MNTDKIVYCLKFLFVLITFLFGVYFIYKSTQPYDGLEPFTGNDCPNVLIQRGNEIHLENTKRVKIPGVNPIVFKSLEEYTEFLKWQRANQIRCPILELQRSYNAQNEEVYSVRPSLQDPQGGLPNEPTYDIGLKNDVEAPFEKLLDAGRDDPPFNKNSYPGFDEKNQYIGLNVPLDKIYRDINKVSMPLDKMYTTNSIVRAHESSETK
tara:strand:+ start:428 stop:1054 length:627 start_codon:yes stop_codon:yes gene_type:complete